MRHVFIVNPAAGKRRSVKELLEQVKAAFPEGDFELYTTAGAGDARQLTQRVLGSGEPVRLYACGGDGTLNEVVNAAAGCAYAAVTNVPMGTGNDFLRIFGKDGRLRFKDIAALRDGPQGEMDLVDCNGHLGLDVVCVGLDARVAADVHRFKRLPLVTGIGAYILALVATVGKGLTQPMEVTMGPIHHRGPTAIVCICNGQYYGGGFRPVPEALPDDGVLNMLLIGNITLFQFIRCVGKYAAGRYRECPHLVRDWRGDWVTISSQKEIVAVIDGETLWDKQFTIKLAQRKVNFFRPVGVGYSVEISTPVGSL